MVQFNLFTKLLVITMKKYQAIYSQIYHYSAEKNYLSDNTPTIL